MVGWWVDEVVISRVQRDCGTNQGAVSVRDKDEADHP